MVAPSLTLVGLAWLASSSRSTREHRGRWFLACAGQRAQPQDLFQVYGPGTSMVPIPCLTDSRSTSTRLGGGGAAKLQGSRME